MDGPGTVTGPAGRPWDGGILGEVERLADVHHAGDTAPGFAYGVVAGGRLVHAGGRGRTRAAGQENQDSPRPGPDTVFRIASMTKSFTAAVVLALRDEGRLRLDDPVAEHLPHLAGLRPPTTDAPVLTVRHLLTMTAGLPTDDPWGDRQQDLPDADFTALVSAGLGFAWTPGTTFEYSNTSYALLGQVIAAVEGRPYRDVVTDRLLEPLGMVDTGFDPGAAPPARTALGHRRLGPDPGWEEVPFDGYGAYAAMGGLFSTVADLARWVALLTGAHPPRDGADDGPLRRSSCRELQVAHIGRGPAVAWPVDGGPPRVRATGYGFGLVVEADPRVGTLVGHSGGYPGFGSHHRWHPGTGLGVVVLANATYAPAAQLAGRMLDALVTPEVADGSWADAGGASRGGSWGRRDGVVPAGGSLEAETEAARAAVDRLVRAWDEQAAAALLAMNVDLDDPLPRRRRDLAEAVRRLGPLEPDPAEPVQAESTAHRLWWLRGPGGRLRCEIRMTPERPSRVQTLSLTPVPEPSAALRDLAERVAAALGDPAGSAARDALGLRAADPADPADPVPAVSRAMAVASAWAGRCVVGPVLAGDGESEAVFRLDGERLRLRLTLRMAQGRLTRFGLVPHD